MTDEPPTEYGLVEPFVVCATKGGPYDDQSFVAGVQYARAEAALTQRLVELTEIEAYFYPALVPQLDLMAMRHGYRLEVEPWAEHPDDWALVRFVRAE